MNRTMRSARTSSPSPHHRSANMHANPTVPYVRARCSTPQDRWPLPLGMDQVVARQSYAPFVHTYLEIELRFFFLCFRTEGVAPRAPTPPSPEPHQELAAPRPINQPRVDRARAYGLPTRGGSRSPLARPLPLSTGRAVRRLLSSACPRLPPQATAPQHRATDRTDRAMG